MEKTDIKSLNLEELTAFITASGEKAFRAKQLYEWMHKKLAPGYEEMTNLPKALKELSLIHILLYGILRRPGN